MAKPKVDYTITVHERDENGHYFITSPSLPGLMIYHESLATALLDVPFVVAKLREFNGDERQQGSAGAP